MDKYLITNDIQLRTPSESEFLEVAQISFENFVNETAESSGESVVALKEKFGGPPTRRSEKDIWLLVEHKAQRIGFIWFQILEKENSAFGWDIYLEREFRSKGIGRYIMKKCKDELLQKKFNQQKFVFLKVIKLPKNFMSR